MCKGFAEKSFYKCMLFRKYLDFSGLYSLKIMIFMELNKKTKKKAKIPASFMEAYPEANFLVVTPDNVEEFLLPSQN